MTRILAPTEGELNEVTNLISKNIPSHRQAYSDRTAFIMASLSELAYLKFNEPFFDKNDKKLTNRLSCLINEEKMKSFQKLYDVFGYDHEKEIIALKKELSLLNIRLIKTFDTNGTQAIIVSTDDYYVLAFRGTEATSIRDIKSDLDAKIIDCDSGGKIHRGFSKAFSEVHFEIQKYLDNELKDDKEIFITGHSLGGALATVASKKLKNKNIPACYTFGSPRVGDEDWMSNFKTPMYRLVNSADPVTIMPLGADIVNGTSFIIKFLPVIGKPIQKFLLNNYAGYYHGGDMRFLTNVKNSNYKNTKLLYFASPIRRFFAGLSNIVSIKKIPNDHSISIYRKKLKYIAITKNQES